MASYTNAKTQQVDLDENGNCKWAGIHASQRSALSDVKMYGAINMNEYFTYGDGDLGPVATSILALKNGVPCASNWIGAVAPISYPVIPVAGFPYVVEDVTAELVAGTNGILTETTSSPQTLLYYWKIRFIFESVDNAVHVVRAGPRVNFVAPNPFEELTINNFASGTEYVMSGNGRDLIMLADAQMDLGLVNLTMQPTPASPARARVIVKEAQFTVKPQ